MLIEQQLACDKGKAAKGPKWSSSQAATLKAEAPILVRELCKLLKLGGFAIRWLDSQNRVVQKCKRPKFISRRITT